MSQIYLPQYETLLNWTIDRLVLWLEENDLRGFIELFKERNIDGKTLLEYDEGRIVFEFVSVSIKQRSQLAKCVNDCKNQAGHVKRQLSKCISECKIQATQYKNSVKRKQSRRMSLRNRNNSQEHPTTGHSNDYADNDSDNWGSDFSNTEDELEEDDTSLASSTSTAHSNGKSQFGPRGFKQTWILAPEVGDFNRNEVAMSSPNSGVVLTNVKHIEDKAMDIRPAAKRAPPVAAKPKNIPKAIPRPPNANFRDLLPGAVATPIHHIARPNVQPPAPPPTSPLRPKSSELKTLYTPFPTGSPDDFYEEPIGGFGKGGGFPQPPKMQPPPYNPSYTELDGSANIAETEYEPVGEAAPGRISYNNRIAQPLETLRNVLVGSTPNLPNPQQKNDYPGATSLPPRLPPGPRPVAAIPNGNMGLQSTKSIAQLQAKLANVNLPAGRPPTNPYPEAPPIPPVKLPRALPAVPVDEQSLELEPYFHCVDRSEAARLVLTMNRDGAFLIRPSQKGGVLMPYTLTLVEKAEVIHLNIRLKGNEFALGKEKSNEMTFDSIQSMVRHHQNNAVYVSSHKWKAQECFLKVSPPR